MTPESAQPRDLLGEAIAAQESVRAIVGDAIADVTIAALRAERERLASGESTGPRRRLATVLFADLVDSTGLLRDRDPEETMTIMDSALEQLAEPIGAHGGRVTRFMGDGFLAVFGLPVSRENDPEMAVRAGLAVQSAAESIGRDLRRRFGLGDFAVRVGINTGLVVSGGATEAEDTIMGAEVNLAARLESAAPPGGVLISHGTLQHVRDRCAVESRGEIEAKGFPEPVPVCLVLGLAEESRSDTRPIVEGITTPMIGRDTELAVLREALQRTRLERSLRSVIISGQPGTGKSRLAREFERTLPDSVRLFRARVGPEDRDVPHGLVRDLLTRCFGLSLSDASEVVRRKLHDGLVPVLGDRAGVAADSIGRLAGFDVGPPIDDPRRAAERALSLLSEYLRPERDQTASVLVFEDLQWADEASLDAVAGLFERLADTPTIAIVVARSEFWADERPFEGETIELDSLDDVAASELVDAILAPVEGETGDLRRLLLATAEGNPHFLEELVRMVVDDGVLVRTGSTWRIEVEDLGGLRVPPTLSGVVQARLDTLHPTERSVLQWASVIGRVFWEGALQHLAGTPVQDLLASLVNREMVVVRDSSSFPDTSEYAFRHPVLREVTYESVLLDDRRRLHGATAEWLLAQAGDRGGEMNGVVATHLEKAGRGPEALEYLTRAAEGARSGYAVTAAADFYDRALALADSADFERRFDLLFGRQSVFGSQGDRVAQTSTLDELEAVTEALDDPAKQARVAIERNLLCFYLGDSRGALAASERAARLAHASGEPDLEVRALSGLAWAHLTSGDYARAEEHSRRALEIAEGHASDTGLAVALNTAGLVSLSLGYASDASAHLRRALDLVRGTPGGLDATTTHLGNLAVARMALGDFEAAWAHLTEAFDLAEAAGDSTTVASVYTNLAWVAVSRGDFVTGRDLARRGLAMTQRQGHREAEAECWLWLGHALSGLGDQSGALESYEQSLEIRGDLEQEGLALGVRAGMARAHLAAGNLAAAVAETQPILLHIERGGSLAGTWEPLRIHATAVRVLDAAGDPRRDLVLERAAAALRELTDKITDPADRRMHLSAIPWHREISELVAESRS